MDRQTMAIKALCPYHPEMDHMSTETSGLITLILNANKLRILN